MSIAFRTTVVPALALGVFLVAGCSTTNEEELAKAGSKTPAPASAEPLPKYKSYGEVAQGQMEADRKKLESEKAAKGGTHKSK